jgi:2-dehydro-3-deoxygluconokinase
VFAQAFAAASTVLITLDDHQALFGFANMDAAMADAQALSAPEVVVKCGASPTLVRDDGENWHNVPTEKVLRVVDTTAAGDSFAAGYLCQRLQGKPALQAAAYGNRLAARVIQHPGAIIPVAAMLDLIGPSTRSDFDGK